MTDLTMTWLGLSLKSPLVVAASPLSDDADAIAFAVQAGAGAVVMRSLFEEQITAEQMAAHHLVDAHTDAHAEAQGFLPETDAFSLDARPYLDQLARLRQRVDVPLIASLNGATPGGWTDYAKKLQAGGADAIELNLYDLATSAEESGTAVEARQLDVVRGVVRAVTIPVSVKLSPFYASVPAFAKRLEEVGARGVVVFNRFYQPDVDLETLHVDRKIVLSSSAELPLRLQALAVLASTSKLSLACTGGVHSGLDAAKAILSGAHAVELASVLLRNGPGYLGVIRAELAAWLTEKGYSSAAQARGVLRIGSAPAAHAWQRLNYARLLDSWQSR